MRSIVFKDSIIDDTQYNKVIADYTKFLKKYANIIPTFTTIDYDFSDYPREFDSDGDIRPKQSFIAELHDLVFKRFSKYGTDYVTMLIHEDNWYSSGDNFDRIRKQNNLTLKKGIWGTAWAYKYRDYLSLYCRWDKKNMANNFGTINHEQDHTYDALIKVEIDIDINPILGVKSYDKETTHGGTPPHKYIRYDENKDKLKILSPYLISAYKKRLDKNDIQKKLTIISLLEKVIELYRQKLNSKNGIKK